MSSLSDSLQIVKEFATKNSKSLENKYVRYVAGAISSLLTVIIVQKVYMKIYRKRYKLPNGATGYPVLGCMPQFVLNLKGMLNQFPKYGPISHYVVLGQDILLLNDYKLAKAMLADEKLLNRPTVQEKFPEMIPMTIFTNGKEWAEGRKLMFNTLVRMANKSFIEKMLKATLEENTFKSIDETIDNNKEWFPADDCRHIAFNTIYAAASGKSMAKNDKNFETLNVNLSKWLQTLAFVLTAPGFLQPVIAATTVSYQNILLGFLHSFVQENIDSYDENNLETWVHHALYEITIRNNSNGVVNEKNSHNLNVSEKDILQLKGEIITMLAAGIDTTGYSLEYAVLVLANNQKYQQMIYDELINKYQNKESFCLTKVNECPILRAFVSELLRSSVPAAQGGIRTALSDYEFEITKDNVTDEYKSFIGKKYVMPKNCMIQFNHYYFFKSGVQEFNINNWLKFDEVNNVYKYESNHPNIFPFSLGKRACPGETIAMAELHYAIAQFVLNYKFKPISKEPIVINNFIESTMSIYPKVGVKAERR